MSRAKYRILTSKEAQALKRAIKGKDLSQNQLADRILVTGSNLSRMINRDIGVNPKHAKRMYLALGKAPELQFLNSYSTIKLPPTQRQIEGQWKRLYGGYVKQLRDKFVELHLDERTKLLGDLERLAAKYGPSNGKP